MLRGAHVMPAWLLLLSVGVSAQRPNQPSSQVSGQRTFTSPDGTFQFIYPSSYTLYTSKDMDEAALRSYIPVCRSAVACVVYPGSKYAGTNFEAASFQASEVGGATTESACLTSPMRTADVPEFDIATEHPTRTINGISFLHGISVGVAAGHSMGTDVYRAFRKGKCYELSINFTSSAFQNFPPGTVKEFTFRDQQRVRDQLNSILDSFRFLK